jgi:hypothetical protein
MAPSRSFINTKHNGTYLAHFILSSLNPFDEEVSFHGCFNYFAYSVNFIRVLYIDLSILNIGLFIEVNMLKAYFS